MFNRIKELESIWFSYWHPYGSWGEGNKYFDDYSRIRDLSNDMIVAVKSELHNILKDIDDD